jgi:hypothetical protein
LNCEPVTVQLTLTHPVCMSVLASISFLKILLVIDNSSFGTLNVTLTVLIERACWLRHFRERISVYFERHSGSRHGVDNMYDV